MIAIWSFSQFLDPSFLFVKTFSWKVFLIELKCKVLLYKWKRFQTTSSIHSWSLIFIYLIAPLPLYDKRTEKTDLMTKFACSRKMWLKIYVHSTVISPGTVENLKLKSFFEAGHISSRIVIVNCITNKFFNLECVFTRVAHYHK